MQSPLITRGIAPGVEWLAACLTLITREDLHSHVSMFLVDGGDRTLLVDAGHPVHRLALLDTLAAILGERQLDFVFPTHPEVPHAGNIRQLATRYPDLVVCGDVRDYHLTHPTLADRLAWLKPGDSLDLGSTKVTFIEPAIRDLPNTLWAHDERSGALFVSDAFGYAHYHQDGQCAMVAEEIPADPTVEQIAFLNDNALFWTRFADLAPYFRKYHEIVSSFSVGLLAPGHGSVITRPARMVEVMRNGMRASQAARSAAS